ncbi:MAG: FKBP-type peptidyl-prolyl cis-trans isomerase [Bacteroidales bacterium]
MKIDKNRVVSLIYELREGNPGGRVIEALEESKPMTFIFGSGRLLPSFESQLSSLENGDNFNFVIDAGSAYGNRREDLIINLSHSLFENDGKLDENICRVGNEVPMMDTNGNRVTGTIIEISDTYVRMDFNHPMAGVDLCFSGSITEVREATDDELYSAQNPCSVCSSNSSSGCSGICS